MTTAEAPASYATTPAPTDVYPRDAVRQLIQESRDPRCDKGREYLAKAFPARREPEILPCTVRPGMGATEVCYTDRHAFEVIAVSASGKVITVRRMKAERDPSWKPDFHPGGFFGHTANNSEQRWILSSNPEGAVMRATWSPRRQCWRHGCHNVRVHLHEGHEHYDYNF